MHERVTSSLVQLVTVLLGALLLSQFGIYAAALIFLVRNKSFRGPAQWRGCRLVQKDKPAVERLLQKGEKELLSKMHPDPYIGMHSEKLGATTPVLILNPHIACPDYTAEMGKVFLKAISHTQNNNSLGFLSSCLYLPKRFFL